MSAPLTLRQIAGLGRAQSVTPSKTALILVDIQVDYFMEGKLPIPDGARVLQNASKLVDWADKNGIAVVHIQQLSKNPTAPIFALGSPGAEIHPSVAPRPGHTVVTKGLPSSFCGTELGERLKERSIDTLIIAGLMTHMCVDSTTREALHFGYRVVLASDACASRDLPTHDGDGVISHEVVHLVALSALADRFADVMTSDEVISLGIGS
jgi:nicotinamidase-related amidase